MVPNLNDSKKKKIKTSAYFDPRNSDIKHLGINTLKSHHVQKN